MTWASIDGARFPRVFAHDRNDLVFTASPELPSVAPVVPIVPGRTSS